YTYIQQAKDKGYDVLLFDGQFDVHFINHVEPKLDKVSFKRVDADIVEKLIEREDVMKSTFTEEQENDMRHIFLGQLPKEKNFGVIFEGLKETDMPLTITQSEFMRRMFDMSKFGSNPMGFYGEVPESYNLIVNTNHSLIKNLLEQKDKEVGDKVQVIRDEMKPFIKEKEELDKSVEGKKDEEISTEHKDKVKDIQDKIDKKTEERKNILKEHGRSNPLVKQLIDIALLANNMLKGEDLAKFVKRSVEIIQ
ncbi:MAG: molecular chaperone HtpG, partial [Bacteroidetes bacterium]|nr:molecular chaperone HtpG [Bacteroidota bacterium]